MEIEALGGSVSVSVWRQRKKTAFLFHIHHSVFWLLSEVLTNILFCLPV